MFVDSPMCRGRNTSKWKLEEASTARASASGTDRGSWAPGLGEGWGEEDPPWAGDGRSTRATGKGGAWQQQNKKLLPQERHLHWKMGLRSPNKGGGCGEGAVGDGKGKGQRGGQGLRQGMDVRRSTC